MTKRQKGHSGPKCLLSCHHLRHGQVSEYPGWAQGLAHSRSTIKVCSMNGEWMGEGWRGESSWTESAGCWKRWWGKSLCYQFNPNQEQKVTVEISSLGNRLSCRLGKWGSRNRQRDELMQTQCKSRSTPEAGSPWRLEPRRLGLRISSSTSHQIQAILLEWAWIACELSAANTPRSRGNEWLGLEEGTCEHTTTPTKYLIQPHFIGEKSLELKS